ncbi:DUF4326 domain-containing protein [Achromobacter xylosoxidans]
MMTEIAITGVGSREALAPEEVPEDYPRKHRLAPPHINAQIVALGEHFARLGFRLRSGAADGADAAFEKGWDKVPGSLKDIYLPWRGFNKHDGNQAYLIPAKDIPMFEAIAATVHPNWDFMKSQPEKYRGALTLHTRNVAQVLGRDAKSPSHMLVCWTPDGCTSEATRKRDTGGTASAIVLAARNGVPIFNLHNPGAYEAAIAYAHRLARQRDRRFHPEGELPKSGETFVFGSNLAGRHGKGAALVAREQFGAVYGQGEGPQGQSYGIATKDGRPGTPPLADKAATLPLPQIQLGIDRFIEYAKAHPDKTFYLARLGCSLAAHSDSDIAPMFDLAPANCVFSDAWTEWLGLPKRLELADGTPVAAPINIWSGSQGLGGALTNMSERAKERGNIKHSYPVVINGKTYPDSEAAYQELKCPGQDAYNDGLMIDIIALKFKQNPKLFDLTTKNGGAAWLQKCSHFTGAKSERFQAWEGQGNGSRFIRNLVLGYIKAKTGRGPQTRVVHVREAPYDVYIGRPNGDLPGHKLCNQWKSGVDGTLEQVVERFHQHLTSSPELRAEAKALKGQTIACWCKKRPDINRLCHGDVVAAVADGREWAPPQVGQRDLFD